MMETLTPDQLDKFNQECSYMEDNEDYAALAAAEPYKDKCYYLLKIVDQLLSLLHCVTCLNNKVDEIFHGNRISERHFKVSILCTKLLYTSIILYYVDGEELHDVGTGVA